MYRIFFVIFYKKLKSTFFYLLFIFKNEISLLKVENTLNSIEMGKITGIFNMSVIWILKFNQQS